MKKTIFILIVCICVIALASCGGEHNHSFAEGFASDATHHWHACEGEGCEAVDGRAEHIFGDGEIGDDGVLYTCEVCGHEWVDTDPDTEVTREEWDKAIDLDGEIYVYSIDQTEGDKVTASAVVRKGEKYVHRYMNNNGEEADIWNLRSAEGAEMVDMLSIAIVYLTDRYDEFTYAGESGLYVSDAETGERVSCGFVNGRLVKIVISSGTSDMSIAIAVSGYGSTDVALPENISDILTNATKSSKFNNVTVTGVLDGEPCELRLDREPNNETLGEIIARLRAVKPTELVSCSLVGTDLSLTVKGADGIEATVGISGERVVLYTKGETVLSFSDYGSTVGYGVEVGDLLMPTDIPLLSGEVVNTGELAGKVIVINFWGTWCPPCKAELPDFDRVAKEYAETVSMIAIHSSDGLNNAPGYIATNFPDSKILFGQDEAGARLDRLFTLFGFDYGYPSTMVVNTEGVVVYRHVGMISYETLKSVVDEALGK